MKELHTDKFDALLSLACTKCVQDEAADFLSQDVSQIKENPKIRRKILGVSRKTKLNTLKIIALVALLCMSVAFTACMLVPEIRQIVWNVFVKGQGDHVEIEFESGEETEAVTEPPVEVYPTAIEKKAQLTYQPEEWALIDEMYSAAQYTIFFSTESQEFKCQFTQTCIEDANSYVDMQDGQIGYLDINNKKAALIEHEGDIKFYSLIWQDEQYRYTLYGSFASISELIKIAEGITIPN